MCDCCAECHKTLDRAAFLLDVSRKLALLANEGDRRNLELVSRLEDITRQQQTVVKLLARQRLEEDIHAVVDAERARQRRTKSKASGGGFEIQ